MERTYIIDSRRAEAPKMVTVSGKSVAAISAADFKEGKTGWYFDASDRQGRLKIRTARLSTNADQQVVIE